MSKQKNIVAGEGNRDADKVYRERTRRFVNSGKVHEAARKAGMQDQAEAEKAEQRGRRRAKELDPSVHREHDRPVKNGSGS